MRICVVYDCLFPHTVGGAERWYRNLAGRLAQDGHEVSYLTLRQWPRGESADVPPGVEVVVGGPRMRLYTNSGRRRILPPLIFGCGVFLHLVRKGRRYDVVHTCAFPYFSLIAAALLRAPSRYELVVDWFEVWSASYWREYLGRWAGTIGMAVQRACARVRQRAFCFSELHAERLRGEGLKGPIQLLRGLYRGSTTPHAPQPAEPFVLFAGRLIPEKRTPLAVAAIASATSQIPGLRAEFVGDGPERGALEREIAVHGLQQSVSALGFLPEEEVEDRMRRAMCLLLPSRREGYGMVVVEAAHWATPSVVVRGEDNAATELVVDGANGLIVDDDRAAGIAAAILSVHERGLAMRESTAAWFSANAERLSLESSLEIVLATYARASASA